PQFNATQYILGITKEDYMEYYKKVKNEEKTIYHLFKDSKRNEKVSEQPKAVKSLFNSNNIEESYLHNDYIINIKDNFDMIVGDIDLIELQIIQKDSVSKRLTKYINFKKLRNNYDYILIDCPPTYSFFFISSYLASDTYIIPLKPDYVSSLGLSLLERAINSIEDRNVDIKSSGVVYTLIDTRNKLHEPVIEEIEKIIGSENVFKEQIKYFADVPRGLEEKNFMLDITNNGIDKSIKMITEEFISRMEGENE
ncbi:ParA family protein, partial [Clostridium tertium]|uniref:ParA family protein n=1 Tax=Clostridium tertium TaxID=1559 RepID=UPI00332899CF